jgi:hypothetical protein
MSKTTGGKSWLRVLVVKQGGKPIEGEPKTGAYTIALKPGLNVFGSPEAAPAQLAAAFKGCTFAWEN